MTTTVQKHSRTCARCLAAANRWSGAWLVGPNFDEWIGWCSNECKNAWLDGDRTPLSESQTTSYRPEVGS